MDIVDDGAMFKCASRATTRTLETSPRGGSVRTLATEVLVVGAGPAGLVTATSLARSGVDFVIVDALAESQNTSRAAVVHARTLDVLEDLGLAAPLVARGIQVTDFTVRDRDDVLLRADFRGLPGKHRYALMIPQDETEQVFLSRLRELGHAVQREVRLQGVRRLPGGVVAECVGPGGPMVITAQLIVGADGEQSTVRAQAGIDFPGTTYGSFLLADVRMAWPIRRDEVSLFFSHEGTLVVAPMSDKRFRVVAQLSDAPSEPAMEDVQRLLDARGPRRGVQVETVLWGSRFRVHHKLADRLVDGPVALVGDAAHVHSPAGGQGMNLGIRDAHALGEALASAVRHRDTAALDAYATSRRPEAERVLRMTDRLTRIATTPKIWLRPIRNGLIRTVGHLPRLRRYVATTLAGYR